jgi:redox-sensitive bicupin YhaK (pirin superfamily)
MADEEMAPAFAHHAAAELPATDGEGKSVRLVAGRMFGLVSPVETKWDTIFADVTLDAGASVPLDADYEERALYIVSGEVDIAGDRFGPAKLLVFRPGDAITIRAVEKSHFVILGGARMDGPRHIWWNFVSSRKERIEQAKADWQAGRFKLPAHDDKEFIPLPDEPKRQTEPEPMS